jgi:two-component system, NtrC family, sensor kinase
MNLSTRTRIVLFFVLGILIPEVFISLLVNSVITNRVIHETQERTREALNAARWVYTSKSDNMDRTIRLTAIRYTLREALQKEKPLTIRPGMERLMRNEGLDFLTLVDRKGTVLIRFHNPRNSGDSLAKDPFIKEALKKNGISGTRILSKEELLTEGEAFAKRAAFSLIPTPKEKPTQKLEETSGMVINAAHPVLDARGNVLGALMGGILLNRNYEIVDRIKNIVFRDSKYQGKEIGTATIFLADLRISTNVMNKEGSRAIGTRAMREVAERVVQKGEPWIQRAYVVDDWYITAYEPLRDVEDKIVGMLYVGILESKYAVLKEKLILLFTLEMLVAVAISSLFCFGIIRKEFWQEAKHP